jgi:hypothetical protein
MPFLIYCLRDKRAMSLLGDADSPLGMTHTGCGTVDLPGVTAPTIANGPVA